MATNNFVNYFRQKKAPILKKKSKRNFYKYNLYFLGIVSSLLAGVGFLNWLIDPQDIFKTPNYWGVNHEKITKDRNDRLYKAVDVIRLQPQIILAGSSRIKQGIDPNAVVLAAENKVYNLGLNGANFYEVRRYIEHAIYNQPELNQIILGLDFFMFNKDLENQATFKEYRLETSHLTISDAVQNLFSFDTLANSLEIIQASLESPDTATDDYGDDGFMPRVNDNTIWRFHNSLRLFYRLHSDYQFSEAYWQDLEYIVELCKQNNIDLKVFISPAHATRWEAIYTTGKWDIFEQWKQKLAATLPVWDFSGYNSITTESIANEMNNYVDESHYSPEIGELVLQRIFQQQNESIPSDFGVLLTPENIEQHLQQIKSDRISWQLNHPEEYELVQKLYTEVTQNKDE